MSRPLPKPPAQPTAFALSPWPEPARRSEQRLTELAARISRTLGVARALADNGRQLDLSGMEDGVGALCAQTMDMAPGEAHCMLPILRDLLTQVDQLTASLTRPADPQRSARTSPQASGGGRGY